MLIKINILYYFNTRDFLGVVKIIYIYMDYKNKYLKYKNKYLFLKNKIGGNTIRNVILTGHSASITTLVFNHDGSKFASGSLDNSIRI